MKSPYTVTEARHFSKLEQLMIWQKPESHKTSQEELRIAEAIRENWHDPELRIVNILLEGDAGSGKTQLAKALSADLNLPYTKVTCFADMDKSDVFGALLPVTDGDSEEDQELFEAIYQTDTLDAVIDLIARHYSIGTFSAKERLASLIERTSRETAPVQYKYYPSEIVRAIEKGYLLEIQEPTVIRDASVLVALNSALELNGMLNLPNGMVRRHPDCVIVITTNRNYQGNRPLNESLRDRIQHAEKMDLPPVSVMAERGSAKTGVANTALLTKMAEVIQLLDKTAKSNAVKGVAGMRSYFYWINSFRHGHDLLDSLYPKVLYKITTDENELKLLEDILENSGLLFELQGILSQEKLGALEDREKARGRIISKEEAEARGIIEVAESDSQQVVAEAEAEANSKEEKQKEQATKETPSKEEGLKSASLDRTRQLADKSAQPADASLENEEAGQGGSAPEKYNQDQKEMRKDLNQKARDFLKTHGEVKSGLIIHRPEITPELIEEGRKARAVIQPIVDQLSRKMLDILEKEQRTGFQKGKYTGTRFDASQVAKGDFRNFERSAPPQEKPSLALALRIDESGSMIREGRIESAKLAAVALAEFSERLGIPLLIAGDTADVSAREKTSIFSYKEFDESFDFISGKIMSMKPRQDNRDGIVLRLLADKLAQRRETARLLISISDGQPKALPDYTGQKAKEDIQQVLKDYERQGILFLAAAIGEDKKVIRDIYGEHRYLDISDLESFPAQLIALISRFL